MRSYRFHSKWKAMKLYPRGTNLRRDAQLKLIMSDMQIRTNLLLLFYEAINSYCTLAMREAMSFTVDTTNRSEDQLLLGFPSAGGATNDIPEDVRGFNE